MGYSRRHPGWGGPGQAARPGFWAPRACKDVDKWRLGQARGQPVCGRKEAQSCRPVGAGSVRQEQIGLGRGLRGLPGAPSWLCLLLGAQDPRNRGMPGLALGLPGSRRAGDGQSSLHIESCKGPGPWGPASGNKLPRWKQTQGFHVWSREAAPGGGGGSVGKVAYGNGLGAWRA